MCGPNEKLIAQEIMDKVEGDNITDLSDKNISEVIPFIAIKGITSEIFLSLRSVILSPSTLSIISWAINFSLGPHKIKKLNLFSLFNSFIRFE